MACRSDNVRNQVAFDSRVEWPRFPRISDVYEASAPIASSLFFLCCRGSGITLLRIPGPRVRARPDVTPGFVGTMFHPGLFTAAFAGYWLEEAAAPYCVFSDAGFEVDIASPEGGTPPCDPGSKVRQRQQMRPKETQGLPHNNRGFLLVLQIRTTLFSRPY